MLGVYPNRLRDYMPRLWLETVVCYLLLQCVPACAMQFSQPVHGINSNCQGGCEYWIQADGQIAMESGEKFDQIMSLLPPKRRITVFLNSAGGSVVGAMALGRALRREEAHVVIASLVKGEAGFSQAAARCVSACTYAFLGGARRRLANGSIVGLHRMVAVRNVGLFSLFQERIYDDGSLKTLLEEYVKEMGADPEMVKAAERSNAEEIHVLTARELNKWRIQASFK